MTKLEYFRKKEGLSRTELANWSGVSTSKIKSFEDDLNEMLVSEATDLANALGVARSTIIVINNEGCFPRERIR